MLENHEFFRKLLIWLTVLSLNLYVLPYSEDIMIYRLGLGISLGVLLYSFTQGLLKRSECLLLTLIMVIPLTVFVLEAAFLNNKQILSTAVVYGLFVVAGYALYKLCDFAYLCRILRIFVIMNLILIPVWYSFGSIEAYSPEDQRLDSSLVINWGNVCQKLVVYDENDGFFPRAAGFTRNPNNLAFLAFIGTVGLFLKETSRKEAAWWGAALCMLFLMTQSRGTLLVLSLFILFVKLGSSKNIMKQIVLLVAVAIGGGGITLLMSMIRIGNDVSSGRLDNWRLALSTINIDGLGFWFGEGYNQSFEKLSYVLGVSYGVDNTYLTLLIEHGLIGSLILLMCLAAAVYYVYRYRERLKNSQTRIFIAFMLAWLLYSLFETVLYKNTFYQTVLTFFLLSYGEQTLSATEGKCVTEVRHSIKNLANIGG